MVLSPLKWLPEILVAVLLLHLQNIDTLHLLFFYMTPVKKIPQDQIRGSRGPTMLITFESLRLITNALSPDNTSGTVPRSNPYRGSWPLWKLTSQGSPPNSTTGGFRLNFYVPFSYFLLTFPVHPTGISFGFFPGFLSIFMLLSIHISDKFSFSH